MKWICFLVILIATSLFLFTIWPGMWEYRTIDKQEYRINRITGSIKVLDPVRGFIEPTPTPKPFEIPARTLQAETEFIKTYCEGVKQIAIIYGKKHNQTDCVLEGLEAWQKKKEKDDEKVKKGEAIYVMPSPRP